TKPGIRKFPRSERIVGCTGLDVSFGAEHKLPGLPVEAKLSATSHAAWIYATVGNLAPFVAEIETGIETGPIVDAWGRRIVIWSRAAREIGGRGRSGGCYGGNRDRHYLLFHFVLHSTPPRRVMQMRRDRRAVHRRKFGFSWRNLSGLLG